MSVVIVGGNDCMVRQYKELCQAYDCKVKEFTQMRDGLKDRLGTPDLTVLCTSAMSHKMLRCALKEAKGNGIRITRSHSSSMEALRGILEAYAV